jgi:hypothetical protein
MTARSLFLVLLLTSACKKDQLLDPQLSGPEPEKAAKAEVANKVPDGAIARPVLDRVLREGPAWLLDKVPVEEVLSNHKFVGWRVRELPGEWAGVDLQAGDVVTRVNAMPVETPNDFWAAWTTLSVASELKIDYLRGAEARVLSVPIVGRPDPRLPASLNSEQRPAEEKPRDKRFDTIRIPGEPVSSEPTVDWTTKN